MATIPAKPQVGNRELRSKEEAVTEQQQDGAAGGRGREQFDNLFRIINISSLNTFLRITFVLRRPVVADRAPLIALVSPLFSGPCWERFLSESELAILHQAIVSVPGKN